MFHNSKNSQKYEAVERTNVSCNTDGQKDLAGYTGNGFTK